MIVLICCIVATVFRLLLTLVVSAVVFIGAIWVNMSVKQRSFGRVRGSPSSSNGKGVGGRRG